ncbi:MAG: SDR family NAD(P)-dependent oxidoreductase [Verrucomicrobiota bacterium]
MKNSLAAAINSFDRVIISGGSSGIGAALIRQLLILGPDLAFCNLSRSSPEIEGVGDRLTAISCDLADSSSTESAVEGCREWIRETDHGKRILLINNSGFGCYGVFPAPNTDRNLEMLDVNVRGPVWLTGALANDLLKTKGAVMNIASTASFQPTPFLSAYGATKAFLLHWSLALSDEWRADGVQVLCVCPGPTETAFFRAAGFEEAPLKKGSGQTAEEVADISLRALAKGKSLVTCGFGNKTMAALSSKLPKTWITRGTGILMRKLRLERHQKPVE